MSGSGIVYKGSMTESIVLQTVRKGVCFIKYKVVGPCPSRWRVVGLERSK